MDPVVMSLQEGKPPGGNLVVQAGVAPPPNPPSDALSRRGLRLARTRKHANRRNNS
ncbi:hypothetical protein BJY04DRAFT_188218 [Aspergillus karnatakaensis]|uniref:uncharacterized protein n=1 Tax=Aspergillus karnatakaensis TaxID=1810916 RepID=UPI003CCE2E84